jgi:predicted transcriptional regulator
MKSKELQAGRDAAKQELIKSEVMTFRLPSDEQEKLYALAEKRNVRVTVMVRDWVIERLGIEISRPSRKNSISIRDIEEIQARLSVIESELELSSKPIVRERASRYAAGQKKVPKKRTK